MEFKLISDYEPTGDQPQAIKQLVEGITAGEKHQTLLGVTGSGKTFSIANLIAEVQKPTLILSHNKTLAAQLYGEFKQFFPENAVEYFVSYYDYYLPEAYIPQTDTYIAKDSSINDEIDKLRLSATSSLVERRDVIIIASVSCIYGLGSPDDFAERSIFLKSNLELSRQEFLFQGFSAVYGLFDKVNNALIVKVGIGDGVKKGLAHKQPVFSIRNPEFFGFLRVNSDAS